MLGWNLSVQLRKTSKALKGQWAPGVTLSTPHNLTPLPRGTVNLLTRMDQFARTPSRQEKPQGADLSLTLVVFFHYDINSAYKRPTSKVLKFDKTKGTIHPKIRFLHLVTMSFQTRDFKTIFKEHWYATNFGHH